MLRKFLLISLALMAVLGLVGCDTESNPFTEESTVSHTFEVSDNPNVFVESFNGRIEVNVGANDTIQADVIKLGVGITSAKAKEDLENTIVTFNQEGADVHVTAVRRESNKVSNSGASVILTVPANATLNLNTSNGLVQINDVVGNLQIVTSNGDVVVTGGQGQFHLETNNGDINVEASNALIYANSNNGDIDFAGTLADGPHTFETSNGTISLTLPEDASFILNASAANGKVTSAFSMDSPGEVSDGRLQGTVGQNPGANLTLRTSNNDIHLLKAGAQ